MVIPDDPVMVSSGIWRISLPDPRFIVNVYLLEGEHPTLIDTGSPFGYEHLLKGLDKLGHKLEDIEKIIYTHHHTDHLGGGALFPLDYQGIHCGHYEMIKRLQAGIDNLFEINRHLSRETVRYFPELEYLIDTTLERKYLLKTMNGLHSLHGKFVGLHDREIIDLESRKLEVIFVPGHSAYHIILIDQVHKLAFGGDFLMAYGPSFIFVDGDNIGDFLQCLDKVEQQNLRLDLVLPGHGKPIIGDVNPMVREARNRVHSRCSEIISVLSGSPKNCIEIFEHFHPGQLLDYTKCRSIFYNLLSYINYLTVSGIIYRTDDSTGYYTLNNVIPSAVFQRSRKTTESKDGGDEDVDPAPEKT